MAREEIERDFDRQKRIGIIIGLFIVAVAGIASWLSRPQEGQSKAVDVHSAPAASFKAHSEVGEIEGRRVYLFELNDGTRCLAISGHTAGGGLDCDWAPRLVTTE